MAFRRTQVLEDLETLRKGVGLTEDRILNETNTLPYLRAVELQLRVEGVDDDERGRIAEELIRCLIETWPLLTNDERELLRIAFNLGSYGRTLTERREAMGRFLDKAARSVERRPELPSGMKRLAQALMTVDEWPCSRDNLNVDKITESRRLGTELVDIAVQTGSWHEPAAQYAHYLVDHIQKKYLEGFSYFSPKTEAAADAVRQMLYSIVDSGEYARLARSHGKGEPLLSELYTRQLIQAMTGHHYWRNRDFIDFLFEAMVDQRPDILLNDARQGIVGWYRDPDAALALRRTIETLFSIADGVETEAQWMDLDHSRHKNQAQADDDDEGMSASADFF